MKKKHRIKQSHFVYWHSNRIFVLNEKTNNPLNIYLDNIVSNKKKGHGTNKYFEWKRNLNKKIKLMEISVS